MIEKKLKRNKNRSRRMKRDFRRTENKKVELKVLNSTKN